MVAVSIVIVLLLAFIFILLIVIVRVIIALPHSVNRLCRSTSKTLLHAKQLPATLPP